MTRNDRIALGVAAWVAAFSAACSLIGFARGVDYGTRIQATADQTRIEQAEAHQPAAGQRAFRCGMLMDAITFAQQSNAPLSATERACWAEW